MPPTFDLVVATVDRSGELRRLLGSLERQSYRAFRLVLVDQNDDDRVSTVLEQFRNLDAVHLRSPRGLSRARNAALPELRADVVAFPDDDCVYPDDLLERVADRFAADTTLDGVTGRGAPSPSWPTDLAVLTRENVWNRAISYALFLRRALVERVGGFDERLGLPSSSGEEIDYLVRAVATGARIEYDPSVVVDHEPEVRDPGAVGARDGESIGYILRKHAYPPQTVARMFVRPAAGTLLAMARKDRARARFHASTLRGRLDGYRRSATAA